MGSIFVPQIQHGHSNKDNLDVINQDLSSSDSPIFISPQVTSIIGSGDASGNLLLYNNDSDNLGIIVDGEGTITTNVSAYENLVTSDNDIPNKKYVDDGLASKEPTLTKGNLSELTSSVLTIAGGTNAVIGSGTTITVAQANTSNAGYLSSGDWNTFNNSANLVTIEKDPTGFLSPESVIVAYDSSTQKVTLTGTTTAYYQGTVVAALVSGWVSAGHTDTAGHTYFLYYDGANFAWDTDNFPGFDKLLICFVSYGTTDKFGIRECHGLMNWQSHKEFHETIGTYKSSGGSIAGVTINSTTAAERRPSISSCTIYDEDLQTINAQLVDDGPYTFMFNTGTGTSDFSVDYAEILQVTGANPHYNQFSSPNWGQSLMPANSVATVWLMEVPAAAGVTNQKYRHVWIQPQWITQSAGSSAGQLTTARNTEALRSPSELNLGTFATNIPEFVIVARVMVQYTGGNWTIQAVTNLTGTKYSLIGSPSGNFLSTVEHDATLTGSGTGADPLIVAVPATNADLTATSPILASVTSGVVNVATTISHAATDGNIHLPSGGSANQILKNSGTAGTGSWGTVTENAGALAAVTTINMNNQLTNTLASGGVAPMVITSTTKVANLHVERATLADTVTVADESTDTSCFLTLVTSDTGSLGLKTAGGLTFNSSTDVLTFGAFPITPSSAPTTDYQVANKKYVDDNTIIMITANTGTAYTIDLANGTCFNLTLNGNVTFTFPATGTANIMREFWIYLNRDATPNRTITWDADIKWTWNTEPSISTSPYALDDNFSYISGAASTLTIFRFTQLGNSSRWYGEILGTGYTI